MTNQTQIETAHITYPSKCEKCALDPIFCTICGSFTTFEDWMEMVDNDIEFQAQEEEQFRMYESGNLQSGDL